uniref:Odorant receptor n=1 Tax=Leucinodes orbonalis TaxID=711050 RepID=A0AAU0QML3_9NEOP|nr:odorant receptor [Leucinodes orbonalis]
MKVLPIKYGLEEVERHQIRSENHKILAECITQYQNVVDFTEMVEDTYHWCLLLQLIGDVGLTCMCAVRILSKDAETALIISIFNYLFTMHSQLFICCWCGHELTARSEDLHTVMYNCMWYEQDIKFKRNLVFVLMRLGRPLVLRAGHYFSMSRQTFVAVWRMSYSYFAVLNQAK